MMVVMTESVVVTVMANSMVMVMNAVVTMASPVVVMVGSPPVSASARHFCFRLERNTPNSKRTISKFCTSVFTPLIGMGRHILVYNLGHIRIRGISWPASDWSAHTPKQLFQYSFLS